MFRLTFDVFSGILTAKKTQKKFPLQDFRKSGKKNSLKKYAGGWVDEGIPSLKSFYKAEDLNFLREKKTKKKFSKSKSKASNKSDFFFEGFSRPKWLPEICLGIHPFPLVAVLCTTLAHYLMQNV